MSLFVLPYSLFLLASVNCQLSTKRAGTGAPPLQTVNCQLSTVNCQLST
ncbi:hypothetical protein [Microcoleus sp. CAWBG58]|nr:hypothetical protein [Microcoleus sp. CAWBG58]